MPIMIFTMLVVLVLAAGVIAVVVMGMEGTGRTKHPEIAEAMQRGVEPGSEEANALAERHRASISQHYDCTASMHVVLARMYTEDPRFTAHYDRRAEGLAAWLRTVIEESARTQGVDPETAGWE